MGLIQFEISELHINRNRPLNLILLRELSGTRTVPIYIGNAEAYALEEAMHGEFMHARPCTHELYYQTLQHLGMRVRMIHIYSIEKDTYFAYLHLWEEENHAHQLKLDCRPSDGLVMAKWEKAPIYIEEQVLNCIGANVQ